MICRRFYSSWKHLPINLWRFHDSVEYILSDECMISSDIGKMIRISWLLILLTTGLLHRNHDNVKSTGSIWNVNQLASSQCAYDCFHSFLLFVSQGTSEVIGISPCVYWIISKSYTFKNSIIALFLFYFISSFSINEIFTNTDLNQKIWFWSFLCQIFYTLPCVI